MLTNIQIHLVSVHILVGVVISIVKQPQVARAHWAQQHRRRIVADTPSSLADGGIKPRAKGGWARDDREIE